MTDVPGAVAGLLLAAGAGRRYGSPKALVRDVDGTTWVVRAARLLQSGGCRPVTVVTGAAASEVTPLLRDEEAVDEVVEAPDWADGMGASLRAGLAALADLAPTCEVAVVHLVDLPDVGADVVARLVGVADGPATLARAAYDGRPGHPVLLGRSHWAPVHAAATGDRGARAYLAQHPHRLLECGDLATGRDRDRPDETAGPTHDQRGRP